MVTLNPISLIKQARENRSGPNETELAFLNGMAQIEQGKTADAAELQKLLAESGLLLQDTNLERMMLGMAHYKYTDSSGKEYSGTIPKNIAMAILNSHLIRASYIEPIDAQIGILNARCILRRVKMKMSEEEYERGGALVVDAAFEVIRLNYLSAVNGRAALVMKSTTKNIVASYGKGAS